MVIKYHANDEEWTVAEDFWDKKGKKITEAFNSSKESVGKLVVEAMGEISSFFNKLSLTLSDKK